MPTYEYICKSCKHAHEAFQTMSAKPLRKCPSCGKNTLERQIGIGAGVIFKGSGFYQTDYRSDSYKKSAEADSKPATSDTKPAADSTNAPACPCGQKPASECASSPPAPSKPTSSPPQKKSSDKKTA